MRADALTFRRARRLRRAMTLPEVLLWQELRPLRFRRQHPVGPYVLDFYHVAGRLAVEVDGAGHDNPEQAAHDRRRDAWLGRHGIRVVRVAAAEVLDDALRVNVITAVAEMVKGAGG